MAIRLSEAERRASLLERGIELFANAPVDELSMQAIAERAGCSKGLLYHYFGGRRGYYVAVLESLAAELVEAMRPVSSLPFEEALRGSLLRFLEYVKKKPEAYRTIVQAGVGVDPEALAVLESARRAAAEFLRSEMLGDGQQPGPLFDAAMVGWLSFGEAAALRWASDGFAASIPEMVNLLEAALAPVRLALEAGFEANVPAEDRHGN